MRAIYTTPNVLKPKVSVGELGARICQDLQKTGVAVVTDRYGGVADYLTKSYFSSSKSHVNEALVVDNLRAKQEKRYTKMGVDIASKVSFKDPLLAPLIYDSELLGAVYNYYKRQAYYRNQPVIFRHQIKADDIEQNGIDIQGKFHLDFLHQITFMLLLDDITENDTHLQFAMGSHLDRHPTYDRYFLSDKQIAQKYQIKNCIGKKGTLVVFDAGNGYHRAFYQPGSVRTILHFNLTAGYSLTGDKFDSWAKEELDGYPSHVQNAFKKVSAFSY